MRKFAWLFLILTFIIWIAIARFWTGIGSAKPQPVNPVPNQLIPIETLTPTIFNPDEFATTSSLTPVITPTPSISVTGAIKY